MMRREEIREYATGSLWVLPSVTAVVALGLGFGLSQINIGPESAWGWLAFQGTADDARSLLSNVTATVVTVIALVLGLTVVALQLSSTQFSPRLLRNFLRDRPNQAVLSVFVATFVYSAAGLYTVGIAGGARTEQFPRLAVTGSIVLLFASLAMVVYFADHLAHSIQVDAIGKRVERDTVAVIASELGAVEIIEPEPPSGRRRSWPPSPAMCRPSIRRACFRWPCLTAFVSISAPGSVNTSWPEQSWAGCGRPVRI